MSPLLIPDSIVFHGSVARRVKSVHIHPEAIEDLFRGASEIVPFLDDKGHVERYGYDWMTNSVYVIISHPDFPEVEAGGLIPIVELLCKERKV